MEQKAFKFNDLLIDGIEVELSTNDIITMEYEEETDTYLIQNTDGLFFRTKNTNEALDLYLTKYFFD